MKITVYGAGYVGLVSAACFARLGHHVICVDINEERINVLKAGECPLYEKGLPELLKEQINAGRIIFTHSLPDAIHASAIHFIATGTPSLPDGQADLSQVFNVAETIIRESSQPIWLVTKSTVPVGTGDKLEALAKQISIEKKQAIVVHVISNPEFLREGTAIADFLNADRIIIGGDTEALAPLKLVYQPLVEQGISLVCMSRRSAELTKYASNTMLACRISFINQISQIAEKAGANIDEIKQGMGLDHRIGSHFLSPGIGYGGSCFPKDVQALIQTAHELKVEVPLFEAIEEINKMQKHWATHQLKRHFQNQLTKKTIGLWGLSFKPDTDDIRQASSLEIINDLLKQGVYIKVYDPAAMDIVQRLYPHENQILWCESAEEVVSGGLDALIIATEWQLFKDYSLTKLSKQLDKAPVFDGRNCFSLDSVAAAGISYYYSIGRPIIQFN